MKLKYLIFTYGDSVGTSAALNRMELLCRGLNESGVQSDIIRISSSFFKKKKLAFLGHLHCLLQTVNLFLFARKNDILLICGEFPYLRFVTFLKNKRFKLCVERNEYPTYLICQEKLTKKQISSIKYFERNLKHCDGFVTCSNYLRDYYSSYTGGDCIFLVLPLVLDVDKFANTESKRENYIAYCGDFGNNKDGVPILIDAFAKIWNSFSSYKLYLIGDTSNQSVMDALYHQVQSLKMENSVRFLGRVEHQRMPALLARASVLALARPANKQAEGGIPSKLAEYLATGRPTVVTNVGELHTFLNDNENIFFSEPDSVDAFAERLRDVLGDYSKAETVGKAGQEIAYSFNYLKQAAHLKNFFLKLI